MRKSSTPYLFKCYVWFVNTIANGPVSREAIDEKWARASVNDYETDAIPESTFHRWRNTVEELFDIEILCNEQGEYYIEDASQFRRADLRGRMLNLLSVNNLLKDCHDLRKQIIFEPVAPRRGVSAGDYRVPARQARAAGVVPELHPGRAVYPFR